MLNNITWRDVGHAIWCTFLGLALMFLVATAVKLSIEIAKDWNKIQMHDPSDQPNE